MRTLFIALLGTLAVNGAAFAEPVAITNAKLVTMGSEGVIDNGTLVMDNGRIVAAGRDVKIPGDAKTIDAKGRVVTPGFMDPSSYLGLIEVAAEEDTVDVSTESDRYTAAFAVAPAVNPRSTLIPVNRIEGITRALTRPFSGNSIFAGQSAIISLGGVSDYMLDPRAAMHVTLGRRGAGLTGGSRAAAIIKLREALEDARDFGRNKGKFENAERYAYSLSRPDLEALQPVLDGRLPVVVDVERASDIEAVLRLAKDFGLKLIIQGGAEAWMVAGALAAANVPVILDPLENLPHSFEQIGSTLENAGRLQRAGVLIAFTQGESHNARNLKQGAGNAVSYGLDWNEAMKALTVNAAKMFGVKNYGSLEKGMDADVVIWDGDPLEVTTFADQVFIQGKAVPMESRQTKLRDRYIKAESRPQVYDRP